MLEKTRNEDVLIYPIAFTVDNSETDFELGVEYKEIAQGLGFKKYKVAPCVNDHPLFVEALQELYTKMKM
jgi:ferrochelatase